MKVWLRAVVNEKQIDGFIASFFKLISYLVVKAQIKLSAQVLLFAWSLLIVL
jgi:hypothetical protein